MFLKFICLIFYFSFVTSQEWNYRGQESWRRNFDNCGGRRQSPINIGSNRLRRNPSLKLNMDSFETTQRNLVLRNTGHTAELTLDDRTPKMTIGVGRDANPFVFQNMHFHWGDNNFKGTEHSVDNNFGSAELHFVHYNQKYKSFSEAMNRRDGIVVVTVLLEISRENNRALEPIIKYLPQILNANSSAVIQRFSFGRLLPRNKQLFFQYPGSLTTPPCSETVTFIIFADPIRISAFQLSQFRRLFKESNEERITFNTRRVQPLNGRVVQVSVPGRGTSNVRRVSDIEVVVEPEPFNEVDYNNNFDYNFNSFN